MEHLQNNKKQLVCVIGLFAIIAFVMYTVCTLTGKSMEETLRNIVTVLIGTGIICFLHADADIRNTYLFKNENHKKRFFVIYIICFVISMMFPLISVVFWPFVAVFVLFFLLSNRLIGFVTGCCLLTSSLLMINADNSFQPFFIYMTSGLVAILLLSLCAERLQFGLPVFVSMMVLFLLLCIYTVLFSEGKITFEVFMMPIINIVLEVVILLVVLNYFSLFIIRRENDCYMEINDPEFPLMISIKGKNVKEYYTAIHTAYLAVRVAESLHLDSKIIKTCVYYHRVGIIEGKKDDPEISEAYFRRNKFPQESIDLLMEYIRGESKHPISKEATLISICEELVERIMAIFEEDRTVKLSSDWLIDTIFKERIKGNGFINSEMTVAELYDVRKLLKKEKLYYDFLR